MQCWRMSEYFWREKVQGENEWRREGWYWGIRAGLYCKDQHGLFCVYVLAWMYMYACISHEYQLGQQSNKHQIMIRIYMCKSSSWPKKMNNASVIVYVSSFLFMLASKRWEFWLMDQLSAFIHAWKFIFLTFVWAFVLLKSSAHINTFPPKLKHYN